MCLWTGWSWRQLEETKESLKDGTTELENHSLQVLHGGKEGKHNHEHWWSNKEIGQKVWRRADSEDLKAEKDVLGWRGYEGDSLEGLFL